jgi:hypothetical protein
MDQAEGRNIRKSSMKENVVTESVVTEENHATSLVETQTGKSKAQNRFRDRGCTT